MQEKDLSEPVSSWLSGRGLPVWAEVSCLGHRFDLLAIRGCVCLGEDTRRLVLVELKLRLSKELKYQAMVGCAFADEVWVAIAQMPRDLDQFGMLLRRGIGVLLVRDGQVKVLYEAEFTGKANPHYRQRIVSLLERIPEGGIAGLPTQRGTGPAISCGAAVKRYLEENPGASWREIFERVPNHYSSYTSMRGALRSRGLV